MTPTPKKKKAVATAPRKMAPRVIKPIEVKPEKPGIPPNPSLVLYRKIASGFIAAAAVLLVLILLLSTTKAVIKIVPMPRAIESSFLLSVVQEGAVNNQLSGEVVEQTFEQAKSFAITSGEQKTILSKSGGTVTIINNSSRNQPLVATTRLLSSGGVLFRLDEGATVPAGGRVEAVVHADQEGPTGDIAPDKFTIPGLATSLQTLIYAESSSVMSGGQKNVSVVTQEELDENAARLEAEILAFAKEQLRAAGKGGWTGEVFGSEVIQKTSDTKPGEEKDAVTVSIKMTVSGVFFDADVFNGLASVKLYEKLPDGFVFVGEDGAIYQTGLELTEGALTISSASPSSGRAELSVELKKDAVVSNTNPFLQPEVFVGKTPEEVKNYLIAAGLASDVSVTIFPPWNGKVPVLADKIIIEVVESYD